MATLIIYGIIAAAVLGAFGIYHHSITVEGEKTGIQKQLAADKPIIEACQANLAAMTKQEQDREKELATLKDSAARQSAAIDAIAKRTAETVARSNAVVAAQAKSQTEFDAERKRLNDLAMLASDGKLSCEQRLAKIEPLVDDALRRLRQQPNASPSR